MRVLFPLSLIFILGTIILLLFGAQAFTPPLVEQSEPTTTTAQFLASTTSVQAIVPAASSSSQTIAISSKEPVSKPKNQPVKNTPPAFVARTESPYSIPPQSFESIDKDTRAAVVNILCMPQGGTLRPISGSGVIIDPRGVILTNAHVAQYVLLSESPQINLVCTVRTGSPAAPQWKAEVLYIPPAWVNDHYSEINADHVVGTGEHDYALLLITSDMQGNATNVPLPYLAVDSRENVAFQGDSVLGAGYPAEFVGGIAAQQGLYAVASVSAIKQLLTFQTSTVDVLSVGGVIEAQGGSSGGPVVNAWRYVVGIITTTSEGSTTATRDLHALSLNYIDRDIYLQTGHTLAALLSGDLNLQAANFSRETGGNLVQKYFDYLSH